MNNEQENKIPPFEDIGFLHADCASCEAHYKEMVKQQKMHVMWPSHNAGGGCRSGKRNHCTCDTCF